MSQRSVSSKSHPVSPASPTSRAAAPLHLTACLVLIITLAAAIAPWLFWGSKALLAYGDVNQWPWNEMAKADFSRVFNRAVLVSALIVLPLYGKRLGLSRQLLPSMDLNAGALKHMGLGFALAAGLLLSLGWVYVQQGLYTLRAPAPWAAVGQPMLSALGASIVEEILFRGLILGMMLRTLPPLIATLACTFLFALVHFLSPPEGLVLQAADLHAGSGFWLVGQILGGFTQLDFLLAEFCTLFAVGWALVQARLATGALWLPIGLHAGWVFGLKWFSALTRVSKPLALGHYLPWVGQSLKVGLLSLLVILITGALAVAFTRRRKTVQQGRGLTPR
jgi:uncharacterized protein